VRRTAADVSSGRVDARAVQTVVWIAALVDVRAVAAGRVHLVAGVAVAPEHTDQVLTATVDAQLTKHPALVDVCDQQRRHESAETTAALYTVYCGRY